MRRRSEQIAICGRAAAAVRGWTEKRWWSAHGGWEGGQSELSPWWLRVADGEEGGTAERELSWQAGLGPVREKKKIKEDGRRLVVFEKNKLVSSGWKFKKFQTGGAAPLVEWGWFFCLGLGFFVFLFFENFKIAPPPFLNVLKKPVFIGRMLLGFSTWSLNFFLFL